MQDNAKRQQDTIDAIASLSNVTIADRDTMAALTQTISRLTVEIAESNTKLVKALADNNELTQQLAAKLGTCILRDTNITTSYIHYCFTYGPKSSHSSRDYNSKFANHKDETTSSNRMGGHSTK